MRLKLMDNIDIKTTPEQKYNNLWKTVTYLCKYKVLKGKLGYGLGVMAYCRINKQHTVSCNDKNCQKMKYALVKQGSK